MEGLSRTKVRLGKGLEGSRRTKVRLGKGLEDLAGPKCMPSGEIREQTHPESMTNLSKIDDNNFPP